MTNPYARLALIAALAVPFLAPTVARADDDDCDEHEHRRPPVVVYAPPAYPAPPVYSAPAYPPAPAYPAPAPAGYDSGNGYGYGPGPAYGGGWRHDGWRQREAGRIRFELDRLERTRDDFYASGEWRPGKVRKFERWYAFRRADLERRLDQLRWYAAR